jgi:hypothetical protein
MEHPLILRCSHLPQFTRRIAMTTRRELASRETLPCACCNGTGERLGDWLVQPTEEDREKLADIEKGLTAFRRRSDFCLNSLLVALSIPLTVVAVATNRWIISSLIGFPLIFVCLIVLSRKRRKMELKLIESRWGVLAFYDVPNGAPCRIVNNDRNPARE